MSDAQRNSKLAWIDKIPFLNKILQGETSSHLCKTLIVYGLFGISLLIIKVLIARLYSIEELGIFTYFFNVITLIFLFSGFGLPDAVAKIIIKYPAQEKATTLKSIKFIIPITLTVLIIALCILTFTSLNPNIPLFNLAIITYILFYTFQYLTYSILRGRKRFVEASFYSLLGRIVFIIAIVTLFYFQVPFSYILISFGVSILIPAIISLFRIGKLHHQKKIQDSLLTKVALMLFLTHVSFYSLRVMDNLVIKYLVDFTSLGIYSSYSSITNIIRMVAFVFPAVIVPMAAISSYKIKESLKKIILILAPISLAIFLVSLIIVPYLYQVALDVSLALILTIASSCLVLYAYLNSILVGENEFSKPLLKILSVDFALSLVLNIFLNIHFINFWGIIGAPMATIVTLIFKILLNGWGIRKLRYK